MPNLPKIYHATTVTTVFHLCFLVLVYRHERSSWLSYLKKEKKATFKSEYKHVFAHLVNVLVLSSPVKHECGL